MEFSENKFNKMFGKVSELQDCPTVLINEYVLIDNDVSNTPIMTEKEILEMVLDQKNSADSNSKSENRFNNAVLVPSTPGMLKS